MYPRHIEAAYESHALHFPTHHMVDNSRWVHLIFVYFIQHFKTCLQDVIASYL